MEVAGLSVLVRSGALLLRLANLSMAGFQLGSQMMTRSAPVSVSPSAPTPVVSKHTRSLGLSLNCLTMGRRSASLRLPSMRT